MARREFQRPRVLKHQGPRPYWYVRYRVKVLTGPHQIERKEKRHWLGNCNEMTKREAERLRDEIMRKVNDQVFTIQNQIPFGEFVKLYLDQHVSTLAPGPKQKYASLLKNHILPEFGDGRLCDVRTDIVQAFLNRKAADGLSWWTRNDLKGVISGSTQRPRIGAIGQTRIRSCEPRSAGKRQSGRSSSSPMSSSANCCASLVMMCG